MLPFGDAVTVGQMLHHTGGLPEYIKSKGFANRVNADPLAYISPLELPEFVRDEPLDFFPGTEYRYSDTDNIVVGLIAERATGLPYDRLLRRYVYRPLGLEETSLPRNVRMPRPYLHGYDPVPNQEPEDASKVISPSGAWASGGIVSTPNEVGRFFRAYVSARLFSPGPAGCSATSSRLVVPTGAGVERCGARAVSVPQRLRHHVRPPGSFPGYRMFAASNGNGRRSVVFSVNAQIVPGSGSQEVSELITRAQRLAVCKVLGG